MYNNIFRSRHPEMSFCDQLILVYSVDNGNSCEDSSSINIDNYGRNSEIFYGFDQYMKAFFVEKLKPTKCVCQ